MNTITNHVVYQFVVDTKIEALINELRLRVTDIITINVEPFQHSVLRLLSNTSSIRKYFNVEDMLCIRFYGNILRIQRDIDSIQEIADNLQTPLSLEYRNAARKVKLALKEIEEFIDKADAA